MLSKMLSEAVEAVAEDLDDGELEAFLETVLDENADLVDLFEGGWDVYEAIEHLDSLQEFKVPSPKEVAAKKKKKNRAKSNKNLKVGNPNNDPWSDYGARGVKGAKGTGGTQMHDVLGSGGRKKTGTYQCRCKNYTCDCRNIKTGFTKTFTIKKSRHLAYNKRYKAHPHPQKDHPRSV